jgi:shikimate kinase
LNIALFGFMGVGKTAIGQILAEKTGYKLIDVDDEIVARAGKSISRIFEEDGEKRFREMEKNLVLEVAAGIHQVIACGGGTILNIESYRRLAKSSRMILLTAEPTTILRRVEAQGGTRPLLQVEDKIVEIQRLLSERNPHYLCAADFVVDTTGKNPEQAAEDILYLLEVDTV